MKRFLAYFVAFLHFLDSRFRAWQMIILLEVPKLEIFCIKIPQLS